MSHVSFLLASIGTGLLTAWTICNYRFVVRTYVRTSNITSSHSLQFCSIHSLISNQLSQQLIVPNTKQKSRHHCRVQMAAWQGGCSFDGISVVNDALWYVLELLERMMNTYVRIDVRMQPWGLIQNTRFRHLLFDEGNIGRWLPFCVHIIPGCIMWQTKRPTKGSLQCNETNVFSHSADLLLQGSGFEWCPMERVPIGERDHILIYIVLQKCRWEGH